MPKEGKVTAGHDAIKDAADALSDLNMFYAIIALCEGSLFRTPSHAAEQRIIKICRTEAEKRLRDHDRAVAKAISILSGEKHVVDDKGRLSRINQEAQ